MIGIAVIGIIVVGGLLFWGYYENEGLNATANSFFGTAQDTIGGIFKLHEDCTQNGSCVAFFANKEPEQHQDMDAGYKLDNVTQAQYYENGTAKPTSSYVTGVTSDTSFSKQGQKQQSELVGDKGQMLVQIGNIATIQSQIKILDNNGEIIEPRYYEYYMTIDCDDSMEFCNLDPISRRGTTDSGGNFIQKWTTDFHDMPGLYKAVILATSEKTDEFDRKYEAKGTLFIELYK